MRLLAATSQRSMPASHNRDQEILERLASTAIDWGNYLDTSALETPHD